MNQDARSPYDANEMSISPPLPWGVCHRLPLPNLQATGLLNVVINYVATDRIWQSLLPFADRSRPRSTLCTNTRLRGPPRPHGTSAVRCPWRRPLASTDHGLVSTQSSVAGSRLRSSRTGQGCQRQRRRFVVPRELKEADDYQLHESTNNDLQFLAIRRVVV